MGKTVATFKYIRIEEIEVENKESVYYMFNKKEKVALAKIFWFCRWKQFCLYTHEGMILNTDCLKDINGFLKELNEKHGKQNTRTKGITKRRNLSRK